MLLRVFTILLVFVSVNSEFASPVSDSSADQGGDLTSYVIEKIFDAQTFDNLYSQILFGQIADTNYTIGRGDTDRANFNEVGEDYNDYGDDRAGRIRRSADSCGIVPEGEECEIVSENGRESRDYKYRENYQKPQYSRPQYKRPAYKDDTRQEAEVISGLVRNGIREWPEASYLTISIGATVPFIPFGLFDIQLPFIIFINYLVERFNNNFHFDDATGAMRRRSFGEDQRDLYEWMDDLLSNTMAVDGRMCVKRFICDIAHVPIKQRSFMGHIITKIITPQSGDPGKVPDEFVEAELTGHHRGDCQVKYGRCPFSIKALLPQLKNQL